MRTKFSGILTLLLAFVVQITFAQEKTISGTVTDDTGLPLPGVNVLIKNTNTGTQSDFDGNYSISASEGQTLVFSYVGFTTLERAVTTANRIDLQMEPGEELDEVVIVAYGVTQKQRVSQSVSTVNSEQIEQVPIASFDQALQGLAAGVNVQSNSGQPGRRGQVIIRGRSTMGGDVNPLYVIDGVPADAAAFRSINSNDISDVSILKDAAATAPYGNRGSNGVILITTKRGNFNSPFKVTYRALHGVSNVTKPGFEIMDAQQYLTYSRDILGSGQGIGLTDEQIADAPNANWTDIMFQQGITNSHEINITNGSENDRSFFSVGYFQQEGITRKSELERFTSRFNYEARKGRFDYSTNVSVNYSTSDFVVDRDRASSVFADNTGGELDNPFIVPYLGLPHFDPYNADGSLNYFGTVGSGALNPDGSVNTGGINGFLNTPYLALNTQHYNTDLEHELKAMGNITANYKLSDVFTVGARMGLDYSSRESLKIDHPFSHRGIVTPNVNAEFKGEQVEAFRRDFIAMFNPYIRFNKEFDLHTVGGSAHMEYNYRNIQQSGFQAYGLNPNLIGSGAGITDGTVTEGPDNDTYYYIPNVFTSEIEHALYSVFALAEYDFDNRYGLTGSIRRDGSSRFSVDNRWGTFYSVSGRWNISNEAFLANSETVSNLRLRASYGSVGNENPTPNFYAGLDRISIISGYQGGPGYVPTSLVDPNLEWETTDQANIGLDFGFMDNRLTGSVDVYDKRTKNLFFATPVSQSSGFQTVIKNQADLSNRGVELQLAYDLVRGDNFGDFNINVFGNGAYNKNEVLGLADSDLVATGAITATAVGQPLRSFYLVEWAGVNPANGMPLYRDADGNLTDQFNTEDRVFSGRQSDPVYTGGFGTEISYKGFSLNGNFSFAADMWRSNGSIGILEDVSVAAFSNQTVDMLDAWQQPGDITGIPAIAAGSTRLELNDRYIEDASFLRLRNLTLAYNFNAQQLERSNFLTSLRVYVQGTNLATWSKWRGFDPESTFASSFFDYPAPRQFTMGVDISF